MEERVVKKLMTSVKCSNCGQNYQLHNVSVLGHHNAMWFFRAFCPTCQTNYLIAATISPEETKIISDLTPMELAKVSNACLPTTDDILDMHAFLAKFNGDFNQLFNRERV